MQLLKTASALAGGRIFNMGISIILLLIQSHYIGPDTTGLVSAFSIPIGYLWILTLGIPSALARDLPYYLATGEREKALKLTQTAQSFCIVMGLSCSVFFAFLSIRALINGNYLYAMGWAFQIILAFFSIYNSYIVQTFRTNNEFVKIAKSNTIAGITQIIVFPLILILPILGLFTKSVAGIITSNFFLYLNRPFKLGFKFDYSCFKELFKYGLPIIIIGYIEANLWTSMQSTLIVTMGNVTYLGLYNFINQILMALLIIPTAFIDILRPKLAKIYGETNGDIKKTLMMPVKPLLFTLGFSIFVIFIAWIFLGDIIKKLLPKYSDAIPAIEIALLIVPIIAIKSIKYIFVVCKNIKYNLLSTVPGFLVGLILQYLFLKVNLGFKYIFLPNLIGQLVNVIITFIILLKMLKRKEC